MTDLRKLIERLKAANGPDAELDDEIWLATIPGASRRNVMAEWRDERPIWEYSDPERNLAGRSLVPDLTASVDASLALVERLLPQAFVTIDKFDIRDDGLPSTWRVWIKEISLSDLDSYRSAVRQNVSNGKSISAPIAILLALLTALQSKDETNVEGV